MILGRLGIRGKLNLLLLLPLTAVLLVAVPFVIVQADDARSAGRTADVAGTARTLGGLLYELQRERLLTAAYLASPVAGTTDLVRQQRSTDDAVGRTRDALVDSGNEELENALTRVGSLEELRQSVLRRGVSTDTVARTYHAILSAVLDALRLVPQQLSDAEGTRQLTVLDALLRANEENELRGMAIISAAVDRLTGQVLLDDSTAQSRMFTERFVQQADADHAGLVVNVDQGDAARAVDSLVARLPVPAGDLASFTSDALTAVEAHSDLRRGAQDVVTGQVADAAAGRASAAQRIAWIIGAGAALLFVLVALLAFAVSRAIADPLRRLTSAATRVADLAQTELVRVTDTEGDGESQPQAPRLAEIEVASNDEIGKLAAAFNRVQSTASMLVERQAVSRSNVSMMFANVAKRTQNLVGRQLTLVDELERDEQDVGLLERLYRLDHLSTRLRRNADNLLVVAGTRDEGRISGPVELSTALRSALAEIEEYRRVDLGNIAAVTLDSSAGADLVLVFAELMENATSFSPPTTDVEVNAMIAADGGCVVSVVDHGIGMAPQALAEENRRLVERERLDIVPTSVLGLFVVGRLARRHDLRVTLTETRGGGVTATVTIPPTLFVHRVTVLPPEPEPVAQPQPPLTPMMPVMPQFQIPAAAHSNGFAWFPSFDPTKPSRPRPAQPGSVPALEAPMPPRAPDSNRAGLRRRVAGAQLPGGTEPPRVPGGSGIAAKPPAPPQHQPRVPATAAPASGPLAGPAARRHAAMTRNAMDDFQSAFARAGRDGPGQHTARTGPPGGHERQAGPPPLPSRPPRTPAPPAGPGPAAGRSPGHAGGQHGGLTRRIPGENLAPGLRKEPPPPPAPVPAEGWRSRDPEAERAAFDMFTTGLARADRAADAATPPASGQRKESQ